MPDTIQVRIRLSRQLDKRLRHAAVDADIPYNDLVRQLLTEGLERDRAAVGTAQEYRPSL